MQAVKVQGTLVYGQDGRKNLELSYLYLMNTSVQMCNVQILGKLMVSKQIIGTKLV